LFFQLSFRIFIKPQIANPLCQSPDPPGPGIFVLNMTAASPSDVKRYNTIKLLVSLSGSVVSFVFILFLLIGGYTVLIEQYIDTMTTQPYAALLLFAAAIGMLTGILSFPFSFYSGYILEHRYHLSNQSFPGWLWESTKGVFVAIPIMTPLLLIFYYLLRMFPDTWWFAVSTAMFLFSIGLSRIAPIIILPLFYKLTPLEDSPLKEKILSLTKSTSMIVEGIYSFNLSKTTKKANAAFTGIGKSKRILLGDTLMEKFSDEEIEVVFAHELGHYSRGHIWKGIAVGTISIYLGLFLTQQAYTLSLSWFGFSSQSQLSALPLLTLWLGLYSLCTSPISNILSRKHEFEADLYAMERTKNTPAFISTMNKLAEMNLADTTPHPMVEFFFYSHPSIEKRIQAAENF
jgi:STE24 endopeptidase